MSAFLRQPLHEAYGDCCCAEMRCCTPEIVTATISGFSGSLIPMYSVLQSSGRSGQCSGPTPYVPIPAYTNPGTFTGVYSRIIDSGSSSSGDCCGVGCLNPHSWESWECPRPALPDPCEGSNVCTSDVVWSLSAFPPKTPTAGGGLCQQGGYGAINAYLTDITWTTDPSVDCDAAPIFCQMPGGGAHYGATPAYSVVCEGDLNGPVVLKRVTTGLRPELYAKVNRSKPAATGAVDAVIRFDVHCRRDWMYYAPCQQEVIYSLYCTTVQKESLTQAEPPGEYYCVDYFCGPRELDKNDPYSGGDWCKSNKCTAAEGYVWPHLIAVSDNENKTATLSLKLEPASWYEGWLGELGENEINDKSQAPYEWLVKSVEITKRGSGYEVGDFFTVYFDPAWASRRRGHPSGYYLTGQASPILPATEANCGFPITWEDKYGLQPSETFYGPYGAIAGYACQQRVRVSEVDDAGRIMSVEVVPWYQDPEFKPGNCIDVTTEDKDKTPVYIRFYRNLCHPLSVVNGGSGYEVGDTISWYCKDPACVSEVSAYAVVTDVDDNGAVLDWHINGSDICMYGYGGWGCSSDNETVADRPDCSRHPYETSDYKDERGAYKFDGKNLCELSWIGKKPARAATNDVPPGYQKNSSTFCNVQVVIGKDPCRTTMTLARQLWYSASMPFGSYKPYRYDSLEQTEVSISEYESRRAMMLFMFPPYPPCSAGGAEVALTFGAETSPDPESCLLGGPIDDAIVIAGGSGYAFKDKTHVQPILPTTLGTTSGASCTATVDAGAVVGVTVTSGGYGYEPDSQPAVTFSWPSGSGEVAEGTASVGQDGRVSGVVVTNGGSGYLEPPTVSIDPPTTGGSGARIKSYSFSSVTNFPGVNYSNGEPYSATANRFSYFPVTAATIDSENRGVGYKAGDSFEIKPDGGIAYAVAWGEGGDDPDSCPNGSWYEGQFSTGLHEDGRLSSPFGTGQVSTAGTESRHPLCVLRVNSVDEDGGILGLDVVEGGMMFRSVFTSGVKHPEVVVNVLSDTGYGCRASFTANTTISSKSFGEVTGVDIEDGGHYYANPQSGFMWTLRDISIGGELFTPAATLMAWIDWSNFYYNHANPGQSGHELVMGSPPPLIRKATACYIGECYHPLLSRTYTLFRSYGLPPASEYENEHGPVNALAQGGIAASLPELWPTGSWAMFRNKSAVPNEQGFYGIDAYTVVEWGQTITLAAEVPSMCPDQTDGRTGFEVP